MINLAKRYKGEGAEDYFNLEKFDIGLSQCISIAVIYVFKWRLHKAARLNTFSTT